MGYRSIVITSPSKLSVKNGQLVIVSDTEHTVPIEDIRTLMIENRAAQITAYSLCALSEQGVCVFFCDEKHLPCALLQPFAQYSRQKKQLELQLAQSKPTLKRLWQEIVTAKIENQALCLSFCRGEDEASRELKQLSRAVNSGDPNNVEGQAAAKYFRALFGGGFARDDENDTNGQLNYGYAILRGFLCRKLADYGFEPCLGIHHCSQVNNFNLADDLIEPFRPLVDLYVWQKSNETAGAEAPPQGLSPAAKRELTNILNYEMLSGGEKHCAAYAMERLIHSYERYLNNDSGTEKLLLPVLEPLARHEYE